jgi:hypothetical protein
MTVSVEEPVEGMFVMDTADNKGVSCVKLRVNTAEDCLLDDAWTAYEFATLRPDLAIMHESDIQLLNSPPLTCIRALDDMPKTPIECPAIVTAVAPDDCTRADLTLETKQLV